MKEIIETISRELKRLSLEGQESLLWDDESIAILRKLCGKDGGDISRITQEEIVEKLPEVDEVQFASSADIEELVLSGKSKKTLSPKLEKPKLEGFSVAPIPTPKPFTLPAGSKKERWDYLRNLVLSDPVCNQHLKPTKNVVFGVGNLDAKIFFCGEAPGADEEIQAEPFVGKAGQLLTKIIGAMGLGREDVYIGNIMNWRPELPTSSGNRPPTEEEMNYCLPYLKAQIEIVNPDVVVALGGTAVNGLLGYDSERKLGKIRGKWGKFENWDLMVTYHPSYLLQYATAATKRLVWEDMMLVMERVGLPISEKQRKYFAVEK